MSLKLTINHKFISAVVIGAVLLVQPLGEGMASVLTELIRLAFHY